MHRTTGSTLNHIVTARALSTTHIMQRISTENTLCTKEVALLHVHSELCRTQRAAHTESTWPHTESTWPHTGSIIYQAQGMHVQRPQGAYKHRECTHTKQGMHTQRIHRSTDSEYIPFLNWGSSAQSGASAGGRKSEAITLVLRSGVNVGDFFAATSAAASNLAIKSVKQMILSVGMHSEFYLLCDLQEGFFTKMEPSSQSLVQRISVKSAGHKMKTEFVSALSYFCWHKFSLSRK